MNSYDPNKHHRRSIRLKGYDYAQPGRYFITLCCQNRICRFGHIEKGKMILNALGKIAQAEWLKTEEIRDHVQLDTFVVMPNHFHAIIQLKDRGDSSPPRTDESHSSNMGRDESHSSNMGRDESHSSNMGECNSPQTESDSPQTESDSPQTESDSKGKKGEFDSRRRRMPQSPSQTIGAIIRGYKGAVTRQAKALGLTEKLWQRNYYERIIRDQRAYDNISTYIINNPAKWDADKFHKR